MNNHQTTNMPHNASTTYTTDNGKPKYFDISILRLIVMDVATFGLYTMYWFYRNLKALKRPGQSNIVLFLKAVFNLFFAYPLFTSMVHNIIQAYPKKQPWLKQAKLCGWMYLISTIASFGLGFVQAPYFVNIGMYVGRMVILCLIQRKVLWHYAKETPSYKPIQYFTMAEVIMLVVGMLFFSIVFFSAFYTAFMVASNSPA